MDSSYSALVAPIHIRKHPNADNLAIGTVSGYQVVTSKSTVDGTMGVFFPSDGQLSHEFCYNNNEYRISSSGPVGQNIDPDHKGGYFEANRRVRTITLRGERSEGYWVPLSALEFTGDISHLVEGYSFTSINNIPICNKYVSPATERALAKAKQQGRKPSLVKIPFFQEHFQTKQLRHNLHTIPVGARIIITEKEHGTSGRTTHGLVLKSTQTLPWWKRLAYWVLGQQEIQSYEHVSGTRRVVLHNEETRKGDFYAGTNFREKIHKTLTLHAGETLYYEIVGYTDTGALIMGAHDTGVAKDKDEVRRQLFKRYGPKMKYTYGCEQGEWKIRVYRITKTAHDGTTVELSWDQIVSRCHELGLEHVRVLQTVVLDDQEGLSLPQQAQREQLGYYTRDALFELCNRLSTGSSTWDDRHIMEGVCLRVEHPNCFGEIYKYKSFPFCLLENIAKNSDTFIDLEDIS